MLPIDPEPLLPSPLMGEGAGGGVAVSRRGDRERGRTKDQDIRESGYQRPQARDERSDARL
jgi:hypothetical protein